MALMARNKLDRKKHVFTDWSMVEPGYAVSWSDALGTEWETPKGISLKVLKPRIETEPMIELEHPWETGYTLHTTILDDDGRHKLYYTCYNQLQSDAKTEGEQNPYTYYLCYAESEDGVSWTKPTIGTVNWRGSTENNIVYGVNRAMGRPVPTATVFKDPSAPPAERYKIIHRGKEAGRPLGCVFGATSPDGIDWTPIEEPLLRDYNSDTQVVARFDEEIGKYRGFFRGRRPVDGESPQIRRTIAYAETDDFNNWPRPETVVTTDVYDHPGTDIYTNGYTVWPDADAHLMFPAFYQREIDVMAVQLLTSRDGYNWERHTREPLIDGGDQGTSGDPRRDYTAGFYAGVGVVSLRPDESSIALISNRRSHNNNRAGTGEGDTLESLQQTHYPQPRGQLLGPDQVSYLAQGRLRLRGCSGGGVLRYDALRLRRRDFENQRVEQVPWRHQRRARRCQQRLPHVLRASYWPWLRQCRRDPGHRRRPYGYLERGSRTCRNGRASQYGCASR